jgi:hypothetical protein
MESEGTFAPSSSGTLVTVQRAHAAARGAGADFATPE